MRDSDRKLHVLDAWISGQVRPAEGASHGEIVAWHEAEWRVLLEDMSSDLPGWWDVITARLRQQDVGNQLATGGFSDKPLRAFLVAGGESYQRRLAEAARTDPTLAAAAVEALESVLPHDRAVWAGKAEAVRFLGVDLAIGAWVRLYTARAASGWVRSFDSVDFWAFHLGGPLGKRLPALGWDFVLGLVAAVPDELLEHVGAAELEDFCWAAGRKYIARIEQEARRDPRFRIALSHVWPGGQATSPGLYDRIRRAVEPPLDPGLDGPR